MKSNLKNTIKEGLLYVLVFMLFFVYANLLINQSYWLLYIFVLLGLFSSGLMLFRSRKVMEARGSLLLSNFNRTRLNIVLVTVFVISILVGALTNDRNVLESSRNIWMFVVFSIIFIGVIITITNFVFTKKTIFSDNKYTDEYINMLFIMLLFGFIAVAALESVPMWLFYLSYIVLFINTVIFTIETIKSVIELEIHDMTMSKVLKNIGVLLLVFVLLIYLQNLMIFNLGNETFIGAGFNLNPYFDLLYYSIVNITSVGFGDITPLGYLGKLTSISSSVFGYVIIFSILGIMVSKFSNKSNNSK